MGYDKDKLQQLHDAALPLMDFIEANHHPHVHAVVDAASVVLSEGIAGVRRMQAGRNLDEAATMLECFQTFESDSVAVRRSLKSLIEKYFGERCPESDANCHNCQHWRAFDLLMANPFKDDVP